MKKQLIVMLFGMVLFITLVSAVMIDDPTVPLVRPEEVTTTTNIFNNITNNVSEGDLNVNSSDYWDDLDTPADITYDEISGGDVNALGYTGTFNFLAGVVGMLSMDGDPWYLAGTDLEIAQNLTVDGNSYLSDTFPRTTLTYSLGSGALRWLGLWVQDINAEDIDAFNLVLSQNLSVDGNITLGGLINGINTSNISTGNHTIDTNFSGCPDGYYGDGDGICYDLNTTIDARTASINYNATSIETVFGTLDDGNLASVQTAKDGNSYNVSEDSGANPLEIRVNFTGVNDFNFIQFRAWYVGSVTHDIEICLWDYDDSNWECEYDPPIEREDEFKFGTRDVYDATDHISGGLVQVQLIHNANGIPSHDFFLDYLILIEGYASLVGEEVDPFSIHRDGSTNWMGNENGTGYNSTFDFLFGNLNWSWIQNAPSFIETETDPLWTSNQTNYYNKTDILGFSFYNSTNPQTETDPIYSGDKSDIAFTNETVALEENLTIEKNNHIFLGDATSNTTLIENGTGFFLIRRA